MNNSNNGLLLVCDLEGRIKSVRYNSATLGSLDIENKLFISLFAKESISKALGLLLEIKKSSASFGWELILKREFSSETYYFGGALIDNEITIFGSILRTDFQGFLKNLTDLNNEQINTIRDLEKEKSANQNNSSYYFNELSRLNNELVGMQRELTKKNIELAELNNLKNQFLGMAAHDLRNPLGYILNYSEFIEEETEKLSEDQIDFIKQIKSLSSFMLNLVTDLLDVSAIEAGEINLNLEPIDIVNLVKKNIQRNRILSQKKEITIHFETSMPVIMIALDLVRIEQVITNLISNAIKYSMPKKDIYIKIIKDNSNIIISVIDQGQGIKKEELSNLFGAFQKTSTKSTSGEKSTGLGLFIVKRIVEAHNGKIWVESEYAKGSTFFVSLPITEE